LKADDGGRWTGIAAVWAVAVSSVLTVGVFLSDDGPSLATLILLAPCLAVLLAYTRPSSVLALLGADLLPLGTTVLLLIGREGLLYVPSLVLLVGATPRLMTSRSEAKDS
jgi:hypothetical protein